MTSQVLDFNLERVTRTPTPAGDSNQADPCSADLRNQVLYMLYLFKLVVQSHNMLPLLIQLHGFVAAFSTSAKACRLMGFTSKSSNPDSMIWRFSSARA